jgi:hypothetical protein
MFLPRLILLILAIGVAGEAAEPLYQQFRPLASFPWVTPRTTQEQVIHRLYREPNKTVRSTLLEEYLKRVPAADFPRVFDLCLQLEEEDSPDDLLEPLLRAWARTDAAAAWAKCKALYEIILPQDPLDVDAWGTGIVVLNPRAVAASDFWPASDKFSEAFSEGVAESGLPQPAKDRYTALQKARSAAWSAAYDAAEKKTPSRGEFPNPDYQPPPLTPEQVEQQAQYKADLEESVRSEKVQRKFLLEILTCPPAEIRARLAAAAPELWEEGVLARALIRWMDGHAERGPEIVENILDLQDPLGVLRGISTLEPIPIEFLVEWALLDRAGFQEWVLVKKDDKTEGRPGLKEKALAVAQAMAYRDDAEPILGGVSDFADDDGGIDEKNRAAFYWAQIDPGNALPWIWSHGGVRAYAEAADSAVYGMPVRPSSNVYRAIFAGFDSYIVPIPGDPLYRIMEQWSDTDAVGCAQYGTRWNLRTGLFTKKRMIRLWTGYEDPDDGAVDDRHFGSLRIWAMRKPEQMRKWIRTEPLDDDVRQALLWLVDHAKGGFGLRKDGSPPVPITPSPAAGQPPKTP